MNIWLITIDEPLPLDGINVHLQRTGVMAKILSELNHQVTWWNSTFNTQQKILRANADTVVKVNGNLRMVMLHGTQYYRNFSLRRTVNHLQLAYKFRKLATRQVKPDIILCSFPPIGLAKEAVRYGRRHKVPVIVDIRNLWPDVLLNAVPKPLRFMFRPFLFDIIRDCRFLFRAATNITGINEEFLHWGCRFLRRDCSAHDKVIPRAYLSQVYTPAQIEIAKRQWFHRHLDVKSKIICFFGRFSRKYDIPAIIAAAVILHQRKAKIKFVICGDGDNAATYRARTRNLETIVFPGWRDGLQLRGLMELSHAALAPYSHRERRVPTNKIIECLCCGLPILSGSGGVMGELLEQQGCAMIYHNDPVQLADMVERICNTSELQQQMSQNAVRFYEENYTARRIYEQLPQYFQSVIDAGR